MADGRPDIPMALKREVLVEAGHRCAIPTCRTVPVELAHITPWAKVQEHTFDNLIALCPTCHARFDRGDIDRLAMIQYKSKLSAIHARYGTSERRLLELFAKAPAAQSVTLTFADRFHLLYLIQDGLLGEPEFPSGSQMWASGQPSGPAIYRLTEKGREVVNNWSSPEAPDIDS